MFAEKEAAQVLPVEFPEGVPGIVKGFFTLRCGGISAGPWGAQGGVQGWNVGLRTGDSPACVSVNRRFAAALAGADPRWMHQVAGTRVVEGESVHSEDECEADGATAVTPGVVLCVQTADCLPVLLADRQGRGIACAHAGWRGLAGGVIENAVRALRERLGDPEAEIAAWLGPRIGFEHFEVGPEVVEQFRAAYPQGPAEGVREKGNGKFLLDLGAWARCALASCGVTKVADCGEDTYADPARYYSYRRDGHRSGRHAALLWIERA